MNTEQTAHVIRTALYELELESLDAIFQLSGLNSEDDIHTAVADSNIGGIIEKVISEALTRGINDE